MGILAIGLLGVAAIFPVGAYYMQKGEVSDNGSAIAQAAFNDVIARGVLNPDRWMVWEDTTFPTGVPSTNSPANRSFQRRFAEQLRGKNTLEVGVTPLKKRQNDINSIFGAAFVIDPITAASVVPNNTGSAASRQVSLFPASGYRIGTGPYAYWMPWAATIGVANQSQWPLRRVTLSGKLTAIMGLRAAEQSFSTSDDLTFDLPVTGDKPAIQRFETSTIDLNGNGIKDDALARKSRGDYSWIVTVVPTSTDARDALATDPSAYTYEVSVVVFYKRPVGTVEPSVSNDTSSSNLDVSQSNERTVQAKVVSTGLNGGEVLLSRVAPTSTLAMKEPDESPFSTLKVGNWIMLCGPHPNSTDDRPLIVARWYRVLSVEGKDSKLDDFGQPTTDTSQPDRRLVSLRGPEWPWQPSTNLINYNDVSNSLYVCIPSGAVAVHSKTVHLESGTAFSGGTSGGFGDAGSRKSGDWVP